MKFTQSLVILALAANAYAACQIGINSIDPNCCWGGKSGSDACTRQSGSSGCIVGTQNRHFCANMGIPSSQCDADCCDTRTGFGKPCPKGKNRCDPDTGCTS